MQTTQTNAVIDAPSGPRASEPSDTIRIGTDDQFAVLRDLFTRASYDEATVARRMGGPHLYGFPRLRNGRPTLEGPVDDVNAALIRLLLDGEPLPAAQVEQLCGGEATAVLRALGVLVPDPSGATALRASVMLVPLAGMWLASDIPPFSRRPRPGHDLPDLVFPPANASHPSLTTLTTLGIAFSAALNRAKCTLRGAMSACHASAAPRAHARNAAIPEPAHSSTTR
jgi:hypothetical protein